MKSKSRHTKAHTFASCTSQRTDHSLQKSVLFADPRRNSNFFSPTLLCFIFFATAQPKPDNHSDSLLQTLTGQCNLTRTTEARTANRVARPTRNCVGRGSHIRQLADTCGSRIRPRLPLLK